MIIVIDSSAGIEIVLERSKSSVFNQKILSARKVITSDLYKIEVANVIWKYVKANLLDKNKANKTLELAQGIVDEFINISENNEEAMNESIRTGHSTYDLLYFTLARRYGASLMTLDAKLKELAENSGIDVIS
jgi:predicted nucleic acid-binding protein